MVITPERMLDMISICNFLLLFPGRKANEILNMVISTQKMIGNIVAPLLSVTPVSTANDEIQPP